MKLFVTALNSGSNGNCYYIGNEAEAVLIDAGISCRETEQRMKRLGLNMKKVKAIFISHEHADHIKGADMLSKKYQLPVYVTAGTFAHSRLNQRNPHYCKIVSHVPVQIGSLSVIAFPKLHDAFDPQSFVVKNNHICVGVFTDIGAVCEHVVRYFKYCHAIFLESNYDDQMLAGGSYPYYLKQRISSSRGHLSNQQALELFLKHKSNFLSHLFLSHISKENNDLQLVYSLFQTHCANVKIVLASREAEIPVYEIAEKMSQPKQTSLSFV